MKSFVQKATAFSILFCLSSVSTFAMAPMPFLEGIEHENYSWLPFGEEEHTITDGEVTITTLGEELSNEEISVILSEEDVPDDAIWAYPYDSMVSLYWDESYEDLPAGYYVYYGTESVGDGDLSEYNLGYIDAGDAAWADVYELENDVTYYFNIVGYEDDGSLWDILHDEVSATPYEIPDFEIEIYSSSISSDVAVGEYHDWSYYYEIDLNYWGDEAVTLEYDTACVYRVQIFSEDPEQNESEALYDSQDSELCAQAQTSMTLDYYDFYHSVPYYIDPALFSAQPGVYYFQIESLHTNSDEHEVPSVIVPQEIFGEMWLSAALDQTSLDCEAWNGSEYNNICTVDEDSTLTIDWNLTNGSPVPDQQYEEAFEACNLYINLYYIDDYYYDDFWYLFEENHSMDCPDELSLSLAPEEVAEGSASFDFATFYDQLYPGEYGIMVSFSSDSQITASHAVGTIEIKESLPDGVLTDAQGHWAEEYILWMYNEGIISGYDDGTFGTEDSVTYAEFAKMLQTAYYEAIGSEVDSESWMTSDIYSSGVEYTEPYFDNITQEHWGYEYIQNIYGAWLGWDSVEPDAAISRGEVVEIFVDLFNQDDWYLEPDDYVFTDMDPDSDVSYAAHVAYHFGFISGYEDEDGGLTGEFGPDDALTRAQISKIITVTREWYADNYWMTWDDDYWY